MARGAATTADQGSLRERLVSAFFRRPEAANPSQTRFHILVRGGTVIALAAHLGIMAVALFFEQVEIAVYNIFSVSVFCVGIWLSWFRDRSAEAFILGALIEMPLHAAICVYYLGSDVLLHGYLLAVIAILPLHVYASVQARIGYAICLFVAYAACEFYAVSAAPAQPLTEAGALFFAGFSALGICLSLVIVSAINFIAVTSAEERADREFARAEGLLRNIMPEEIAARLKTSSDTIAEEHSEATILFADIVGFTRASRSRPPKEVVDGLNEIFSAFDALAEEHGVEKIKTIGDAYMAVAGVTRPDPRHAETIVGYALAMLREIEALNARTGREVAIRIGVNTGPVVAGVIGQTKFAYDLWGDAVNVASRMESTGLAGKIQISEATWLKVRDLYECAPRGVIEVKGRGAMATYSLPA